jgi:protein TonB
VTPRPWLGLVLSVALHAGLIALVLTVAVRDETRPAVMIDLREPLEPGAPSVESPAPRAARAPRGAPTPRRDAEPRPKTSRHAAAKPAPPSPKPPATPPLVEVAPSAPATITPAPPPEPPREPVASPPPPGEPAPTAPPAPEKSSDTIAEAPARAGGAASPATGVAGAAAGATSGPAPAGSETASTAREPAAGGPRVASVPPGGGGSGVGAEYGSYLAALRQRIQQSLRYPATARRRGLAGTVSVEILILANGSIGEVTLLESSSHPVLDDAALDTIRSLPRMPLPPELPARPLRVRVPVVFQMR